MHSCCTLDLNSDAALQSIRAMPSNVKVTAPGLQSLKKQAKNQTKAKKKKEVMGD